MDALQKLWDLAEQEARTSGREAELSFDPIGLYLFRPFLHGWYTATPLNTSTFANTGCEGVHFGFLHIDGAVSPVSPIVMTVPMNFGQPNLIVGSDLRDFLCLGCETGYTYLEQLLYRPEEAIEDLMHPSEWRRRAFGCLPDRYAHEHDHLLGILVRAFNLKPWDRIDERLSELQGRFLALLETSPDQYCFRFLIGLKGEIEVVTKHHRSKPFRNQANTC